MNCRLFSQRDYYIIESRIAKLLLVNNPLYHDTYKLLRCYRDSTYSLMVAVRQVEIQFQLEYNTSVDEFLDSIYAAGADLGDSQIEEWAKSIARSNKMIKLLLSSVDLLRKNHKHGEEYYWILYYAFLSPHELKNTEEILGELEKYVPSISYRTYYRRRQAAINALSSILWRFSAKGTLETLNKFFPK